MNNFTSGDAIMYSVAVNPAGLFVAVGSGRNYGLPLYATSTDGTTWITPTPMNGLAYGYPGATMSSVVYSAGLWVAVGWDNSNAAVYATSTDGSTWPTPARMNGSGTYAQMTSVAVNGSGIFVAVGTDANDYPVYATSTNGTTWTTPASMNGSTNPFFVKSVASNAAGLFVAVGYSSGTIYPTYATSN
jgi:hypothetical protein